MKKGSLRNTAVNLAKWLLAGLLIWYMITTGKLDIAKVIKSAGSLHFLAALGLILLNAGLTSIRWNICLRAMGVHETFWSTFEYTMIGLFFNNIMPGSIGGDLVKGYLIAQNSKGCKARAIVSVLVDRVFGLATILIIGFTALMLNPLTATSKELQGVAMLSGVLLAILLAFFLAALIVNKENRLLCLLFEKLPMGSSIREAYAGIQALARSLKYMSITLILSFLVITASVSGYAILTWGAGSSHPYTLFYSCVPIGFIALVIPISPGGLGVGQAAYFKLYQWHGIAGNIGAEVFTLFQLATLLAGIFGLFFYLLLRKRVDKALEEASASSQQEEPLAEQAHTETAQAGETA